MGRAIALMIGLAIGMGSAVLIEVAPAGLPAASPAVLIGAALLLVGIVLRQIHRGMASFERGHDERAAAFRYAMLAEHAPHLLETGHATKH